MRQDMQEMIIAAAAAEGLAEGAQAMRAAANIFEGQGALARALGCSPMSVSRWCRGETPIPPWMAQALEAAADGVTPPRGTAAAIIAAGEAGLTPRDLGMMLGVNAPTMSAIALSLIPPPPALGIAVAWCAL